MGKIILLDNLTANKIAAGEVVERPASVVKELVENSIDAAGTRIDISILDGGLQEILISDNGTGMDREDALLAFERHATSKISSAVDLGGIKTLGFRGEALASIAAVSRLNLKTKTGDSLAGTEVVIEGGKIISTAETGCAQGTMFRISDLFFNTPARKKHMKSPHVESGHISEIVNKIAMAHPEISFQLKNNNKVIFKTTGNGNLLECIAKIYGPELAREMLFVSAKQGNTSINGYVGKPSISRSARSHQVIYINGRYVKDRILSEGVEKAYHSMLMTGRHPVFVLNIQIDPEMVDVNVHPAKTLVRIDNIEELRDFIYQSVQQTLTANRLIPGAVAKPSTQKVKGPEFIQPELNLPRSKTLQLPQAAASEPAVVAESAAAYSGVLPTVSQIKQVLPEILPDKLLVKKEVEEESQKESQKESQEVQKDLQEKGQEYLQEKLHIKHQEEHQEDNKAVLLLGLPQELPETPEDLMEPASEESADELPTSHPFPDIRPVAQIDNTYIIAQGRDGMYIIDQHAAHERVLYEKYMFRPKEHVATYQLLFPESIQLTHLEAQFLVEAVNYFAELGFIFEHFGGNTFLLRGVPAAVSKDNARQIFLDLLDYFSHNRYKISGKVLEEKFLITMACKNAIKANQSLGPAEMQSLLEQLANAEQPFTCPHGRPTIIHMSGYELEKRFKRVL